MPLAKMPSLPQVPRGVAIRHIPGWPGYAATSVGQVYTCRNSNDSSRYKTYWRLRSLPFTPAGYHAVALSLNGKIKRTTVSRLVLMAFRGPPKPGQECCHNNGVRADDRLSNLRWDTKESNFSDKKLHGTDPVGERHPSARLKESDIKEIRERYVFRGGPNDARSIAADYGISRQHVNDIVNRKTWRHLK